MTTPASALMLEVMNAIPGVGNGPTMRASTPMEHIPAIIALSSMYPERRVSLPITILCRLFSFLKT